LKLLLLFMVISSLLLTGCNDTSSTDDSTHNYNTARLSANEENVDNTTKEEVDEPLEEPLSSFSTNILRKDPDRQTNITIACNSLNGLVVKAGETFSFCDTLGPARPEDGYKKANGFDSEGNTIQVYGGGKCQISTTLYNAVLNGSGLTVVERHEHSAPVYYVELGQDACVSYGSCDFKFRNDNDFDIKIVATGEQDTLTVSLFKI